MVRCYATSLRLFISVEIRRSIRNGSLLLLNDNSLLRFVAAGVPQFPRIPCRGSARSDCSGCRGDGRKVTRHNMYVSYSNGFRDRAISLYSTLYTVQTSSTACPHTSCTEIELLHCTVHCTLYRRATRHVLTRVAPR
jgi:hypothetical protein